MSLQVTRGIDREKHRATHKTYQDTEDTVELTRDFDTVRSNIFNFHSIRSVIIAKLRTKSNQTITMYKYKIDTGNAGKLIPIKMFKVLFPNTKIANLSPLIRKWCYIHTVTHAYHTWAYVR